MAVAGSEEERRPSVDRAQKEALVASMNETLQHVELLVVTQQSGLTVAQSTDLRRQIREAGAGFKVTKNRLTRLALEGTKFQALQSLLTGPTPKGSRRSPSCRLWTGYAACSSASCRPRPPSWPVSRRLRPANWPACSAPTALRATLPEFGRGLVED
jgi:hypothetical protein